MDSQRLGSVASQLMWLMRECGQPATTDDIERELEDLASFGDALQLSFDWGASTLALEVTGPGFESTQTVRAARPDPTNLLSPEDCEKLQ